MKCRHCKKEFKFDDLIVDCVNTQKNKIYRYYSCTPCNTEKCRKYRKTEIGRKKQNEAVKRSVKKHFHKQQARIKLNQAIKKGIIKRGDCIVCGQPNAHGHHEDYSKPLDVMWFCRTHHIKYEKTKF